MRYSKKFKARTYICVALVFCLLALSISAIAEGTYKTSARVNFRTDGSMQASIIKTLNKNTAVKVTDYDPDGWSSVTVGETEGYIKSEYLNEVAAPVTIYKTNADANLRSDAAYDGTVIQRLAAGTAVTFLEKGETGWTLVDYKGTKGFVKSEFLTTSEAYDRDHSKVELSPWSTVKGIFKTFTPAKVYDVRSGAVYYVQSFSNGKHADVETLTKEDTAILKKTFGGKWSWTVRPVWVTINGHTFAGSINGMPHASGTISDNGMNGQVCIHFLGSTTHNGNKRFAKVHQNGVQEAWNDAQDAGK